MHVTINLNPKHETYQITSFFEWLANCGHHVEIICDKDDVVDSGEPVDLDNLPIAKHHLRLVDRVIYVEGRTRKELYKGR